MKSWRLTHLLYRQELGFRGNGTSREAGPYVLIPKDVARKFFPRLSQYVLNDTAPIAVRVGEDSNEVLLPFVYHNSRHAENRAGGRDEYRLYIAGIADRHPEIFAPDVVIDISPCAISVDGDISLRIDPVQEFASHFWSVSDRRRSSLSTLYVDVVEHSREESSALSTRATVSGELIDRLLKLEIILPPARRDTEIAQARVREAAFRRILNDSYSQRCALTNKALGGGGLSSVEGAHIVPVADGGSDNPCNGIPLVRDLHWAFDRGFFTFDSSRRVIVHPAMQDRSLFPDLHSFELRMPRDLRLTPSPLALEWHRRNVFGRFANG